MRLNLIWNADPVTVAGVAAACGGCGRGLWNSPAGLADYDGALRCRDGCPHRPVPQGPPARPSVG